MSVCVLHESESQRARVHTLRFSSFRRTRKLSGVPTRRSLVTRLRFMSASSFCNTTSIRVSKQARERASETFASDADRVGSERQAEQLLRLGRYLGELGEAQLERAQSLKGREAQLDVVALPFDHEGVLGGVGMLVLVQHDAGEGEGGGEARRVVRGG